MHSIAITKAKYIKDYCIELEFNDKTKRKVDFNSFLSKHNHPQYNKYKEIAHFKKFKLEMGNIVWGKEWDLVFPVYDLYSGKL